MDNEGWSPPARQGGTMGPINLGDSTVILNKTWRLGVEVNPTREEEAHILLLGVGSGPLSPQQLATVLQGRGVLISI